MGRHAATAATPPQRGRFRVAIIAGLVILIAGGTAAAVTVTRGGGGSGDSADCPHGSIDLIVRADPAAAPWLRTLAGRYAATHRQIDDKCVAPKVSSLAFDDARSVVQSTPYPGAGAPPDVWVPDSTAALDLLRAQSDNGEVLPQSAQPIATSPLVLAAPEQTVLQWQKDGANSDLQTLLDPGSNGAAQINTPDPSSTGTGLASVLQATAQVTKSQNVNSGTYSTSAAQIGMLRLRARMATTAPDGPALLNKVGAQASADNMVAVSEQDVIQYNKKHSTNKLESYNAFGATRAVDYPYVMLHASWISDQVERAAQDFQSWLISSPTQNSLTEFGLRRYDGTAGGLAGAGADDAHGKLDGAPDSGSVAAAHSAWTLLTTKRSVLSLIDISASMDQTVPGTTDTKLDLAQNTALAALPYLTPNDQAGLSQFTGAYKELVPLGTATSNSAQRASLQTAYQGLEPQGGTALYDGVLAAYDEATQHYLAGGVNVVVVLSDGGDTNSKISLDVLLSELKKRADPIRPVHIVTIAYGADADLGVLKQISQATDGVAFSAPDPRSISTIYISALAALSQ
jgi:Ca-activated chloride channel family protein